jgi:hypothetical protein
MGKEVLVAAVLLSVLLIVSGVDECSTSGIGGAGKTQTQAASYGLDFTIQKGLDKLSDGSEIKVGSTFFVDILMENNDPEPKSGEICLKDNIDDAYGGIPTLCRQFNIPAAVYIENTLQAPSSIHIAFPESDYFKYELWPVDADATATVSVFYTQHSVVSGIVKAPEPATETLTLTQRKAPILVTVEKTISGQAGNVNVNLKIGFQKQGNYNITSLDYKTEKIMFSPRLGTYTLNCPEANQGVVDFASTKFISCSALLPREQISHPLLIDLNYGVKLIKPINFKLKV